MQQRLRRRAKALGEGKDMMEHWAVYVPLWYKILAALGWFTTILALVVIKLGVGCA